MAQIDGLPAPRFPGVVVQLTGSDGNAMAIIGTVSGVLRRAGYRDAAKEFAHAAMDCGSYVELLAMVQQWVEVE